MERQIMTTTLKTDDDPPNLDSISLSSALESHIERCRTLVAEVDEFVEFMKSHNRRIEINNFRREVGGELRNAEEMQQRIGGNGGSSEEDAAKRWKRARGRTEAGNRVSLPCTSLLASSNVVFFQAVWDAAKRSSGVVTLRNKRIDGIVDVVFRGGLEWLKVSMVTERRLLMEMTRMGWEWTDESDDEEFSSRDANEKLVASLLETVDDGVDEHGEFTISILQTAKKLSKHAATSRCKNRVPTVTFVVPRLIVPSDDEDRTHPHINVVLDGIRNLGIKVVTAQDLSAPAPPLDQEILVRMGREESSFTDTLNLDCTMLLALVSDISHGTVDEQPWFNDHIRRQLRLEHEEKLLPTQLWPVMDSRRLVCAMGAATQMKHIVDTIGTPTEKARGDLLLRWTGGDATVLDDELEEENRDRRAAFQRLSSHRIPENWRIPVRVCEDVVVDDARLPPVAARLAGGLDQVTPGNHNVNRSVFLSGWAWGFYTLTSNAKVSKWIEATIDRLRKPGEPEGGPLVWISVPSRSLIAKEKHKGGRSIRSEEA